MPSAGSTRVEQSRGAWWSRTRSESSQSTRSEKALHRTTSEKSTNCEPSPRNTLPGAIASVFGFKPKRVLPMPIQDPPLPARPATSPADDRKLQRTSTRKSTKTRASLLTLPSQDAFDDGPPTPLAPTFRDPHRRESAFTIAEDTPYTSRRTLDSPSPSLSRNGRLSPAYVPSSSPVARKDESQTPPHSNRTSPISRASTSSMSQNSSASSSPRTPGKRALPVESAARKPSTRRSPGGDDPRRPNLAVGVHHSMGSLLGISQQAHEEDEAVFVIPKSVSSSTLTEKFRNGEGLHAWTSQPDLRSRPRTAQGADPSTPTGLSHSRPAPPSLKSSATPQSSRSSSDVAARGLRPRVLIIPSASRPGPAPSAPPTGTLPLPPFEPDTSPTSSLPSSFGSSAASSGDNDMMRDRHPRSGKEKSRTRQREPSTPRRMDPPLANNGNGTPPASPSRTVKKTSSHNSLTKRIGSQSNIPPSSPSPALSEDSHGLTKLQKHRSLHNTRMPRPPLPLLRHANSFNAPGVQTAPLPTKQNSGGTDSHQTSSSAISTTSKKRLFSGSALRRPSTSSTIQALEDDVRSLFSIRSEAPSMQSQAFPNAMSSTSSSPVDPAFWDEASQAQQIPISPAISAVAEYMPQRIMSPEDMLKVEASVMMETTPDPSWLSGVYFGRSRTLSFGTISTSMSDAAPSYMSRSALSPPPSIRRGLERASAPPPGLPPGTPMWSGGSIVDHVVKTPAPSMIRPPTPHSHHASHHVHAASLSSAPSSPFSSTCELPTALSPPPRPRPNLNPNVSFTPERTTPDLLTPLSPPPPRRPVQVAEARPALLRKPSFLDIEDAVDMHGPDEHEKDGHVDKVVESKPVECSFLDFGGLESPRYDRMEEDHT